MPSPRPVKPSRSEVVALTLIRSASMPAIAASAARIAAACGPIFGASQTSVQSRWVTAKPRAAARSTALRRKISDAAPFHGRVRGREPLADVAFGQRAEDRVGQRVHADVGVGMADEAAVEGDARRRRA